MNAKAKFPDVAAIAENAKSPDLAALERQIETANAEFREIGQKLGELRDKLQWTSPTSTEVQKSSWRQEAVTHEAVSAALAKTVQELHTKIAAIRPASLQSVRDALAPAREQAAAEIIGAKNRLYDALARYNSILTVLDEKRLPASIPMLNHIVERL